MRLNPRMTWIELPSIQSWPGEAFNFENRVVYDVFRAISNILRSPADFQFSMMNIFQFEEQLAGRGNIDPERLENMSPLDAIRPVLIASETDGIRLIDGYHRATKCLKDGEHGLGAWILNLEQTASIRSPYSGQVEALTNIK